MEVFAECGIENSEFIVSERVQVMSALTFLLFKLKTLQQKKARKTLSLP